MATTGTQVNLPAPNIGALPVTLQPSGGDDWPALLAAMQQWAYKRPIVLAPGVWNCKSAASSSSSTWIPNGTRLFGSGRNATIIRSWLTPTPSHTTQYNSPFFSFGQRDGDGIYSTTLVGAHSAGAKFVTVTSTTGASLGQRIILQSAAGGSAIAFVEQFIIVGLNLDGANTLRLDRPTKKPYLNTDQVNSSPGACDITIANLTISGTGDRAIELICGRDCLVYDVAVDGRYGAFSYFAVGFDLGATNNTVEQCVVNVQATDGSGGVGGACYAFESGFNNRLINCVGKYGGSQNVVLPMTDDIEVRGGSFTGSQGPGIQCSNGSNTAPGSTGIKIIGANLAGNDTGVSVLDDSKDIEIIDCTIEGSVNDAVRVGGASLQNLLRYSQQFTNAVWQKNAGATVLDNAIAAPDGTTTAASLTTNGSNVQQNANCSVGVPYTFSVWLKADAGCTTSIVIADANDGSPSVTKPVTLTTAWQRFSVSTTGDSATNLMAVQVLSATGRTVYMWGAQLTDGDWIPAQYAASTSAAVNASPTLPARVKVNGGRLRKSGAHGVHLASGRGHRVAGATFEDNAPGAVQGHIFAVGQNTSALCDDNQFFDNGTFTVNSSAFVLVAGGAYVEASRHAYWITVDAVQTIANEVIGVGSTLRLRDSRYSPQTSAAFLFINGAGIASLTGCKSTATTLGVYVDGTSGTAGASIGPECDFSATSTPFTGVNGGTVVPLSGVPFITFSGTLAGAAGAASAFLSDGNGAGGATAIRIPVPAAAKHVAVDIYTTANTMSAATTATLYKNGSATAIALTINAAATGLQQSLGTVAVSPGDQFDLLLACTAGGVGHSIAVGASVATI